VLFGMLKMDCELLTFNVSPISYAPSANVGEQVHMTSVAMMSAREKNECDKNGCTSCLYTGSGLELYS